MLKKSVKLSKRITIGLEPSEKQLESLASKGFKTIVNLSAKGELGQILTPEEAAKKAVSLGIEYFHFPVSLSRLKATQAKEFITTLNDMPEPVYIHCRIGQRSVPFGLLAYATKHGLDADKTLARCEKLGVTIEAPFIVSFIKTYLKKFMSPAK